LYRTVKSILFCTLMTFVAAVAALQPAVAQSVAGLDGQPVTDTAIAADASSGALLMGEPGSVPEPKSTQQDKPDPDKLQVVIYPILGWAPIYGANFHLPDTPSTPGGGSGSINRSFNGAALFGFTIQKGHWYGAADAMWAGLSGSRSTPLVKTDVNAVYGEGMVGYKFYKDLYFTGAFRRIALDYKVTLGSFPQFERKPGVWDPLIGLMWNQQLNKKWKLRLGTEGGGFGVGSEVDFSASGMADWQFAKHFGMTFGYALLHLKVSDTDRLGHTFTATSNLNGPTFGFGIYF